MNADELTGRTRSHIVQLEDPHCALHVDVVTPFLTLRAAAAEDGIVIEPFSAFRDFEAQVAIWNNKFSGKRPLYDQHGVAQDHAALSPGELVQNIMVWSAIPGASRHHWGTEIDVIDRASVPPDYDIKLLPGEYAPGGVFHRLNEWLDANMATFGFFRPYASYLGGVYPEPWHLSYAPVSVPALNAFSVEALRATLAESEVMGKDLVLAELPRFFSSHVVNICPPAFAVGDVAPTRVA
jgi:LAS superfamily LD-carboxypeptidase LdcB